ncbi:MAG: MerR family transcriptional regulator [Candidatus Velthaea sp.]
MRIGELAAQAGVTQKAVRYYESRGVLRSQRIGSGYREFDERALEVVRTIRAGKRMGLHLEDLREVLEHVSAGLAPCSGLRKLIARQRVEVGQRIEELKAFDAYLQRLDSAADSVESGVCPIIRRSEAAP